MGYVVTSLGTTNGASGGTLVLTTTIDCPPNSLLVMQAVENGSNTAIGSVTLSVGGTPTLQNSKALANSNTNGWGGAWTINKTTVDIPSGSTITYTRATSAHAATLAAYFVTGTDGNAPAVNLTPTAGSTTTPSIGPATVVVGQLVLGFCCCFSSAASWTEDSNSTDAYPFVNPATGVFGLISGFQTASGTSVTYSPRLSIARVSCDFLLAFNPASPIIPTPPRRIIRRYY
jgi:hypothetical protein